MPNQTEHGKAFEFACLKGLENIIATSGQSVKCHVEINETYKIANRFFDTLPSQKHKDVLLAASRKMATKLADLEPRLIYPVKSLRDIIDLEIQPDGKGIHGDVRDVLALRILLKSESAGWEIGISCKHNHRAVKHQRISPRIDIGKQWLNFPSDSDYFNEINPVFTLIDSLRKSGTQKWLEVKNKDTSIYKPLLESIRNQIERFNKSKGQVICGNFLAYLIGKNDFYKVVLEGKKSVSIQGFNFNNTLNQPADNHQPKHRVSVLKLPTRIYKIEFKDNSNNTINVIMDEGWSISMRIHNASTKIENSLKLDVQLIGVPQTQYRETLPLEEKL
ncbi:HaeIII family restriction endonuclease [Patescibacteria group bacterium]|nr:HaeIII family restriction endonuclease [Patescibacteria group bacterium]